MEELSFSDRIKILEIAEKQSHDMGDITKNYRILYQLIKYGGETPASNLT